MSDRTRSATGSSLFARSLLAVLLLVGFYVLAFGIAAFLLWTVYAQVSAGHVIIKLAFVCVVLAGMIVWSVLPRPDRFEPPGPELSEAEHPRLFALIRDVARQTEQEMPREVYLVADVNAFVAQRGGMMGFFSRRVMGLGLPLLSLLSVAELRAVLAHEFGHYHGGDTMLGPWIYKTRAAIVRTVVSLAQSGSSIVRKPFEWYGVFFLKVTHSISRAQELAADALAARVAGARHLVSGLKAVHGGAAAYTAFVQHELAPVLEAGYRPPLAQGFRAFLASSDVQQSLETLLAQELESSEHDPFDTHPPLARRIEALAGFDDAPDEGDRTPALELLGEREAVEAKLVAEGTSKRLEGLAWANVTERVFVPQWRKNAKRVAKKLGTLKLAELVRTPAGYRKLAARVLKVDFDEQPELGRSVGANLAAAALTCTLIDAGWNVENELGSPVVLRSGERALTPFALFASLQNGELKPEDAVAQLEALGVAGLVLDKGKSAAS